MTEPSDASVVAIQVLEAESKKLRDRFDSLGSEIGDCELRLKAIRAELERCDHLVESLRSNEASLESRKQHASMERAASEQKIMWFDLVLNHFRNEHVIPDSQIEEVTVDDNGAAILHGDTMDQLLGSEHDA